MAEIKDIRLVIEISNKQPLELLDLTKSFVSLANQFNTYVARDGSSKEDREAKLYVKEIRSGSVIMELVEYASAGAIPFIENVNTIVGFGGYLKDAYNFILGKSKEKPTEFLQTDLKDLSQIVNPIANDSASQLNISTTINGTVELHLHLDSTQANAAQNLIEKLNKEAKVIDIKDDIKSKVLLTLYQTRTDIKAKAGNKGVIEDISSKPMNILFEDEKVNEEMLHADFNPNETVYVVDVMLMHVGGKLAAYKIVKFHETFTKD